MIKIIHTADIHLDSKVDASLPDEIVRERRTEAVDTFVNMIEYARDQGVLAILIAGDLFDKPHVRKGVRRRVLEEIRSNPGIDFLLLAGNHGHTDFLSDVEEDAIPENLKFFDSSAWTAYAYGDVTISGRELSAENSRSVSVNLILDESKINIVALHGREPGYTGRDRTPIVEVSQFKGKFIDYLALGHIHRYTQGRLDERGTWCYPGILEGRSFQESGEKGFVLLEIDEERHLLSQAFVPFAKRRMRDVEIAITEDMDMEEVEASVDHALREFREQDLVRVVLTGQRALDLEVDPERIEDTFGKRFYYFKLVDLSSVRIDYDTYLEDRSLKGEFVRLVRQEAMPDEEKASIIELGMRAILGDEV